MVQSHSDTKISSFFLALVWVQTKCHPLQWNWFCNFSFLTEPYCFCSVSFCFVLFYIRCVFLLLFFIAHFAESLIIQYLCWHTLNHTIVIGPHLTPKMNWPLLISSTWILISCLCKCLRARKKKFRVFPLISTSNFIFYFHSNIWNEKGEKSVRSNVETIIQAKWRRHIILMIAHLLWTGNGVRQRWHYDYDRAGRQPASRTLFSIIIFPILRCLNFSFHLNIWSCFTHFLLLLFEFGGRRFTKFLPTHIFPTCQKKVRDKEKKNIESHILRWPFVLMVAMMLLLLLLFRWWLSRV